MKSNKKGKLAEEAVNAFKPDFNEIKSDTDGSYTGTPEDGEEPVQDSDDL